MLANRPHSGFGSSYSPVNKLMVVEAYMKVNRIRNPHKVIDHGQWVVKKMAFKLDDKVSMSVRVVGQGFGYLYASFGEEETQILDIKKVHQGVHHLNFSVPQVVLSNFRLGISSTIPQGYNIDLLPNDTQYKIRTNSLMLQQHKPMYESPGIGFAGFGAFSDRDINDPAKGGADTAGNPYWDGNFDNFDWSKHLFSGEPGQGGVMAPKVYGSLTGYYGHRASMMTAKFNENDEFLGWDAKESRGSSGSKPVIQAGVPTCMVLQMFVINRKQSDWISLDDNRTEKSPKWRYANNMAVPKESIMFAHENFRLNGVVSTVAFKNPNARPWSTSDSCISDTVGKQPAYYFGDNLERQKKYAAKLEWYNPTRGTWSKPQAFPDYIPTTTTKGFTKVIFRVPRQLNPVTDKDIINQIQSAGVSYSYEETKKIIPTYIKELNPGGTYGSATIEGRDYTPAHVLLGRPDKTDTLFQEPLDTGDWFLAPSYRTTLNCFLRYPNHPKAGYTNPQRDSYDGGRGTGVLGQDTNNYGRIRVIAGDVVVGDVEKFARMNYPELITAFFPPNGFVPGGKLFVIARGFSTKTVAGISIKSKEDPISYKYVEGKEGSQPRARINLRNNNNVQIILSTDLEDTTLVAGETQLQEHWKNQFGEPLTPAFFANYNNNLTNIDGTPRRKRMTMQSPDNPLMYRVNDPGSGFYIDAPYQIMIITLDEDYSGPAAFYTSVDEFSDPAEDGTITKTTKLVVTKPEKTPYARGKGEPVYLNTRTPFGYTFSQEIDIIEEVEQQVEIINATGDPSAAVGGNDLDNDPVDTTAAINTQAIIDEWLKNQQENQPTKQTRKERSKKLVRPIDALNPYPKYWREGNTSLLGLGGFSNSRDFYVEDVTDKWTANKDQAALGGYSGLGNVFTDAAGNTLEFAQDSIFSPIRDALAENIGDGVNFLKTTGKYAIYSYLAFKLVPLAAKATVSTYDVFNRPTRPATAARRRAHRRYQKRR